MTRGLFVSSSVGFFFVKFSNLSRRGGFTTRAVSPSVSPSVSAELRDELCRHKQEARLDTFTRKTLPFFKYENSTSQFEAGLR